MKPVLSLLAMLMLSGCAALGALNKTPLDAYELRGNLPPDRPAQASGVQLVVEPPVVGESLKTDRILIRPSRLQAQYLPDGRWTEAPSEMLRTALVRELGATGRYGYVGREPLGGAGDHALLTEITDFNPELRADGRVVTHLRVSARLVREMDIRDTRSRVFEVSRPAKSTATPDLIVAMDAAMSEIVAAIVGWVGALD